MTNSEKLKAEADRLACTGMYKQAAKLYRKLGLNAHAEYYETQAKIKRS